MGLRRFLALPLIGLPMASGADLGTGIEEILVQGQRLEETIPLDLSRYGNQVELITAEQIQRGGFVDVTQTLQMLVPGLHIAPKNGPFDYFSASLQGSRAQDILWLVDGVRITNRLYNGTSPLDTIPAHRVERIEVLKGGQGIFYGTQSVGGVINIVTKGFQPGSDGAVSTAVSSNDAYRANGYWRGGTDRHQVVLFASRDKAEGHTPYRDEHIQPSATDRERGYEVDSAGLKYAWNVSADARLSLQYQHNAADLDFARPFRNRKTVNAREESIATMKYDQRLGENTEVFFKAYQHRWDTRYTRIYNELDADGNLTGGVDVLNDASYWGYEDYGYNAMARFDYGRGFQYVIGFDQQNFSGEDDVWRIGKQEETINAPFAQIRTTEDLFDNTLFALGVRANRASNQKNSTVWNLTGKHNVNDDWYVQGNLGTSFRSPDAEALFLNEIYDPDNDGIPESGFAVGNPDLKPEESENLNISLGGAPGSRLNFELTYFTRDVTNYIASYVPTTIAGVAGESFVNSDDEVNINGFELKTQMALTNELSAQLSYTRTRARFNDDGPQLRNIPEQEAKVHLDWQRAASPWGLSLAGNYVGEVQDRGGLERDSYLVTDLSAYYHFGSDDRHQVVARIENLTDKDYVTGIGVGNLDASGDSYFYDNLGMERTFHLSYSYSF
ncbi:MAG: TonB-dependent receptor [Cellvibrionaceae bacterium]